MSEMSEGRKAPDQGPKMRCRMISLLGWICFAPDLISKLIYRVCYCFILWTAYTFPFCQIPRDRLQGVRPVSHHKLHLVLCSLFSDCWSTLWIFPCPSFGLLRNPTTFLWWFYCSLSPLAEVRRKNVKFKWVENDWKFILRIMRDSWQCELKLSLRFSDDFTQGPLSLLRWC